MSVTATNVLQPSSLDPEILVLDHHAKDDDSVDGPMELDWPACRGVAEKGLAGFRARLRAHMCRPRDSPLSQAVFLSQSCAAVPDAADVSDNSRKQKKRDPGKYYDECSKARRVPRAGRWTRSRGKPRRVVRWRIEMGGRSA
jgi:hypothetical protein